MPNRIGRLFGELAEEASRDDLVDMWIAVGARLGAPGWMLFADDEVAARAVLHLVSGSNDPLQSASREFLQGAVAHGASRERMRRWLELTRKWQGRRIGASQLNRSVQSLLDEVASERTEVVRDSAALEQLHQVISSLVGTFRKERLFEIAADVASRHPHLTGQGERLRSLLAFQARRLEIVRDVAGGPREVQGVEDVLNTSARQAALAGAALGRIWQERMLNPAAAAVALGAKPTNREKVRQYRKRSWLLGLPRDRGRLYPAFQFDRDQKNVNAHARRVNEMLGARDDPWGVASWWVSSNDLLAAAPRDLLGTPRADEVVRAANSLLEPLG